MKSVSVLIRILVLALGCSLGSCGYQPPIDAEEYNPEGHADHRVDLTSADDILELYQILKDAHEVFTKCGFTYWADSGTLLGAIRNGGIIPWDDDNDLAFFSHDVPQLLKLRPVFTALGYSLEDAFFGYRLVKPGTQIAIDLFKMKEVHGRIYYEKGEWGKRNGGPIYLERQELLPIKEVPFGPVTVRVPQNPGDHLEAYFRGWSTVAFTYGHQGQRKFKIDLKKYPQFKNPAPLDPNTLQTIDVRGGIKDRVASDLQCPPATASLPLPPVRPYYDGA